MPSTTSLGARLFAESSRRVIDHLSRHVSALDWSVSRIADGAQVHVHVEGNRVVSPGTEVPWESTFCNRMTQGAARIVPDARQDPDYADLEATDRVRAYAGVPLHDDEGDAFGVLCGFGPQPMERTTVDEELITLLGDLLSAQFIASRRLDQQEHDAAVARAEACTDALTDLLNRRGWELAVAEAQSRLATYGDPVAVIVIDLDGLKEVNDTQGHAAGDQLLVRAAQILRAAAPKDHVARYGGDEFTVLSYGLGTDAVEAHLAMLLAALAEADVAASGGAAAAPTRADGLRVAFEAADRAMYAHKRNR